MKLSIILLVVAVVFALVGFLTPGFFDGANAAAFFFGFAGLGSMILEEKVEEAAAKK